MFTKSTLKLSYSISTQQNTKLLKLSPFQTRPLHIPNTCLFHSNNKCLYSVLFSHTRNECITKSIKLLYRQRNQQLQGASQKGKQASKLNVSTKVILRKHNFNQQSIIMFVYFENLYHGLFGQPRSNIIRDYGNGFTLSRCSNRVSSPPYFTVV